MKGLCSCGRISSKTPGKYPSINDVTKFFLNFLKIKLKVSSNNLFVTSKNETTNSLNSRILSPETRPEPFKTLFIGVLFLINHFKKTFLTLPFHFIGSKRHFAAF